MSLEKPESDLPLFTYGFLRPGEIAYPQIERFVDVGTVRRASRSSGASSIRLACSFRHNQYFTAPPFPDRYDNRYETQRREKPREPGLPTTP
jgi:hypothetical protein